MSASTAMRPSSDGFWEKEWPAHTCGPLSIGVIGPTRFGLAEPYAGGLERHTAELARAMVARGHRVTVYAGHALADSPGDLHVVPVLDEPHHTPGRMRADTGMPPGSYEVEERAYAAVLARVVPAGHDVVHNNSLHYLPPLLEPSVGVPMVHTLHTPPFDWLERAHAHLAAQSRRERTHRSVVAVSQTLADRWGDIPTAVIHNGVTMDRWTQGTGTGDHAVWVGRIVAEKAPHLAIDAARMAGLPILLAGQVQDPHYFRTQVKPRLGEGATWLGHLADQDLNRLYGRAVVGIQAPQWDEPFGLVAAEMLACGTPIAAFRRGALPEILGPVVVEFAAEETAEALAEAVTAAIRIDRDLCRKVVLTQLSSGVMAQAYEMEYRTAIWSAS